MMIVVGDRLFCVMSITLWVDQFKHLLQKRISTFAIHSAWLDDHMWGDTDIFDWTDVHIHSLLDGDIQKIPVVEKRVSPAGEIGSCGGSAYQGSKAVSPDETGQPFLAA